MDDTLTDKLTKNRETSEQRSPFLLTKVTVKSLFHKQLIIEKRRANEGVAVIGNRKVAACSLRMTNTACPNKCQQVWKSVSQLRRQINQQTISCWIEKTITQILTLHL